MPEIFRFPGCESFTHGLGALETLPFEGATRRKGCINQV